MSLRSRTAARSWACWSHHNSRLERSSVNFVCPSRPYQSTCEYYVRLVSWGAAGWHICFDVLDHLLSGTPIGRFVGGAAMKFEGWQRLNAEYAMQFGIEVP